MGLISGLMGNAGVADPNEIMQEYGGVFTEGETLEIAFTLVRDKFIFTNKRMIMVDKQGITGKKTDIQSVLYKSISRFSIETAGHLDLDAELKIYIGGGEWPVVSKKFNKKVNIYDLQKVLASHLL